MDEYMPHVSRRVDYARRLLVRLQREVFDRGRQAHAFPRLCDMAAIPRDLRAALLQDLVLQGYVQAQGGDLIALTTTGRQQATMPAPVAAVSDIPSPRDGISLRPDAGQPHARVNRSPIPR